MKPQRTKQIIGNNQTSLPPPNTKYKNSATVQKVRDIISTYCVVFKKELLESLLQGVPFANAHFTGKWTENPTWREIFETQLDAIDENLSVCSVDFRKEVFKTILAEVNEVTDRVEKLLYMERGIRAIYKNLDTKTKGKIAILKEIAALDGLSCGVDFGPELLYDDLCNRKHAERYIRENPDDADIKILAEAFELAKAINDVE